MNRYGMLFLGLFFLTAFAFLFGNRSTEAQVNQAYQPLEGTLYKGVVEDRPPAFNATYATLPRVLLYVRDFTKLGLKSDTTEFTVKVSDKNKAIAQVVSMTTASPLAQRPRAEIKNSILKIPSQPLVESARIPIDESFKYFNEIMESSDSSFPLSGRFRNGGVTFQLHQICKWESFYLIKYSVLNEEPQEFFVSNIQIKIGNQNHPNKFFMPISYAPGQEEFGIVKFAIKGTSKARVDLVLRESGNSHRSMEIKNVEYLF